ncbi:MAG: hypothetical protein K0S33_1645 [Bacteroidetes bacterium]|jgi:hypothetical protein|nr:hypothetical protein [Bacteroidota bacterium]
MSRNSKTILLGLVALICSCRPKYSPEPACVVFNDFEAVSGWRNTPGNNSQTVTWEDSHSGKFSYKIGKGQDFGYYYKNKLRDISDKKISWVKISGYCKSKSDKLQKTGILCCILDDKDVYKKWSVHFMDEFTAKKKDKWVYFEKSFDIGSVNDPGYFFSSVVCTTDSSDQAYIDDFKIEFFN